MTNPARCWVADVSDEQPFGIDHLPYGSATTGDDPTPRLVVRIGDFAVDLARACARLRPEFVPFVDGGVLNPLLAATPATWRSLRVALQEWLSDEGYRADLEPTLLPLAQLHLQLPIEVADYVDFYAFEQHASNVGQIFRPDAPALPPSWKSLPIGYHGRAGTVVVSGTPVRRPCGQWLGDGGPRFGPSERLDFEAEIGFVVGDPTPLGESVALADGRDHIFGVCLLNDWSARDLQRWETVPLGPFTGKSFATSIAAWITPLDALAGAWCSPPPRDPSPLPYLDDAGRRGGLDLRLTVELNGEVISRPPAAAMYWTPEQMITHLTANGASLRAGDLFASGTVSGAARDERGCLLELSWGGTQLITLSDHSERTFLLDGDEVTLTATAVGPRSGALVELGEVRGRIVAFTRTG